LHVCLQSSIFHYRFHILQFPALASKHQWPPDVKIRVIYTSGRVSSIISYFMTFSYKHFYNGVYILDQRDRFLLIFSFYFLLSCTANLPNIKI
jgi:hypothetical protein